MPPTNAEPYWLCSINHDTRVCHGRSKPIVLRIGICQSRLYQTPFIETEEMDSWLHIELTVSNGHIDDFLLPRYRLRRVSLSE